MPYSRLIALGCAGLILAAPIAARAEDPEKQVARMNKRAMEDYDALEFESARKTLVDAVALLRSAGLDESPVAAKTYMNLGIIFISGFKDRNRGQQQLVNALKINPNLKLDPALATPELDEAFSAALKQVGKERPGTPVKTPEVTPPPRPPVEEVKGLQHNPVDEAKPGMPIPIKAQLGADSGATRVFLFYRMSGQEDYVAVALKNVDGGVDWVGEIPENAVIGRTLQYYLEARDARSRPILGSGSAPNPYIITVSAGGAGGVAEVDVEDPLMRDRMRRRRAEEDKRHQRDRLFVFVMPGFGFGYVPGGTHTEVAWQYQGGPAGTPGDTYQQAQVNAPGGVVVAPFHLAIELGGFVTPHFALSLLGRFELYTGANAETVRNGSEVGTIGRSTGAVAVLARARYRFLPGRIHPYVHVDFGGGEIRSSLDLSKAEGDVNGRPLVDKISADAYNDPMGDKTIMQQVCANPKNCSDSIQLGYLFLGGGAGLWYDFAQHFALIVDVNLLGALGVGSAQRGLNIDLQLGVGAHFL
jgi:hypothetical protein